MEDVAMRTYRCIRELDGLQVKREQLNILPLLLLCHIYDWWAVSSESVNKGEM